MIHILYINNNINGIYTDLQEALKLLQTYKKYIELRSGIDIIDNTPSYFRFSFGWEEHMVVAYIQSYESNVPLGLLRTIQEQQ